MMAKTEPSTLDAAFIAQAHSTMFPLATSAGSGRFPPRPASARSPVGKGMPMAKPSGTSNPALTSSLARNGRPTKLPSNPGRTAT